MKELSKLILLLFSNTPIREDGYLRELSVERDKIYDAWKKSNSIDKSKVSLEDFSAPSSLKLEEYLTKTLEQPITVIHFAGHGTKDGFILDNNKIYTEHFARRLQRRAEHGLRLVFFNSCVSEEIARSVESNNLAVVYTNEYIRDEVARNFSETFYAMLFSGNSLEQSYNDAVDRVKGTRGGIDTRSFYWEGSMSEPKKFPWELKASNKMKKWKITDEYAEKNLSEKQSTEQKPSSTTDNNQEKQKSKRKLSDVFSTIAIAVGIFATVVGIYIQIVSITREELGHIIVNVIPANGRPTKEVNYKVSATNDSICGPLSFDNDTGRIIIKKPKSFFENSLRIVIDGFEAKSIGNPKVDSTYTIIINPIEGKENKENTTGDRAENISTNKSENTWKAIFYYSEIRSEIEKTYGKGYCDSLKGTSYKVVYSYQNGGKMERSDLKEGELNFTDSVISINVSQSISKVCLLIPHLSEQLLNNLPCKEKP